ncbi:acriflavin resistance protein [Desulfurobacterium thermolithotrophum DSM 11699]|uniref:Acriflavin resistance protein n=1 Tax=Desulfurobacterium thermolithotrophum (strain DSM 11699 / BSA) TaxID=868864 RepID=F0S388_DESTD|nr:efflux RND transporter permease subunit [Desulfurobacterium thermolithotrophum]ADY73310.1 acriflavin resistance protein [Desulfurobacterium thermolithotrophum DSM 11699]
MKNLGIAGNIAKRFITSKLTPLFLLASMLIGLASIVLTPKEEEPQIVVPMVDVFIPYPGASAKEVERKVSTEFERLIWEIKGIDYVYSISKPGMSLIIARFKVGENMEDSLVRLYNQLMSNLDKLPPGALKPLVKPMDINDVPIVSLTLWSNKRSPYELRELTKELCLQLKQVENVSKTWIIGGDSKRYKILVDQDKLKNYNLSLLQIVQSIKSANVKLSAGKIIENNTEFPVEAGEFIKTIDDLKNLVVTVYDGKPVYLKDVAKVVNAPIDPENYVFIGFGPNSEKKGVGKNFIKENGNLFPAVTIAIAKKRGTNAVTVAKEILNKFEDVKKKILPSDVHVTITRNYGKTAQDKFDELMFHLGVAIFAVVIFIGLTLGIKEAFVVSIAIPTTLALTLFVDLLTGYTLNRVTLFALIFTLGLLVDDAIVVVENIHRHLKLKKLPPLQAAIYAVAEVGNPTILATFTVIAALLPMAFVSGLMGPYMRPIPVNASIAMFFSLIVAFVISPWAAYYLLRKETEKEKKKFELEKTITYRVYNKLVRPLLDSSLKRWAFLFGVFLLMIGSVMMFYTKAVVVKLLPFDNKSEFQVVVDMPEGTSSEETARVTKAIADYLSKIPEVTDYELYIGTSSPFDFNGLVRHYYLRKGGNVADIRVNLIDKGERKRQSHDIAREERPKIQAVARSVNPKANVKIVEVPPGPPVLSTLVAEIYGKDDDVRRKIAKQVAEIFRKTPGVVDVDTLVDADHYKYEVKIDREKARKSGITEEQVVQTVNIALKGASISVAHTDYDSEAVSIFIRLPRKQREGIDDILNLSVLNKEGNLIPLREIATIVKVPAEKTIYHKNLHPVSYVIGDVAGKYEAPIYPILAINKYLSEHPLPEGYKLKYTFIPPSMPKDDFKPMMKWDGEWQITYETFRDMGAAFIVALIFIYLLIVGQFQSFIIPIIIMIPIPLTMIGIIPGHWLMTKLLGKTTYFTATSMIGFIALAGIVVRNSIILMDFILMKKREGAPLKDSIIEAGAVRFRPIVLTAAAAIVGAAVILLDPIFQGLAVSLLFGVFASTTLTLIVIPVIYYMLEKKNWEKT